MQEEENESLMRYLKKEVEACLMRNDSLEKENEELRQQVVRLKAQITCLKAHDTERKSMLWKKLHTSNDTTTTQPDFTKLASEPPSKQSAPPPPPLPSKAPMGPKAVRRVPEVVELYRLLTRKNGKKVNSSATPGSAFTSDMIGEMEKRSSHVSAVKSDVEKRKELIDHIIKQVKYAAFTEISQVETFVKWVDDELRCLVDERAVLKHFKEWPEGKADALREAAFNYRDLANLSSDVSAFEDNPKHSSSEAMGKMEALQQRLETCVDDAQRTRESRIKKYTQFQIPCEWLLDTGLISQIKLSSLKLAKQYMKRIISGIQLKEFSVDRKNIQLQGAKFAYRVHQFVGGFDADTLIVFQELKKLVHIE
ncbi:protein CHUP1, chloroplastic [Mercurialis annua]|uniref:protein CHUP1, chloroplastic n=1 Tax=Mercurialis annua TaxID=3986 RepID=UPI00215EC53B|nr:protein CHUP1, chloroplastic [Mercurialis annua]